VPPDELVVRTKKDGTNVVEVEILSKNATAIAEKASGLSDEELAKLGATKIIEKETTVVEKEVLPWWLIAVIAAVCAMCILGMFFIWRKKRGGEKTAFVHTAMSEPGRAFFDEDTGPALQVPMVEMSSPPTPACERASLVNAESMNIPRVQPDYVPPPPTNPLPPTAADDYDDML